MEEPIVTMDSKDGPESSDDTGVAPQPEAVSNSEIKDSTESCIEEVSEENEESDRPDQSDNLLDKDISEMLDDEMNREETAISDNCEKDSSVSNVNASESTICLESTEGDYNAEVEVALSEDNSDTVTIEANNVLENTNKEDAPIYVDAETTEPDGGSCEENALVHADAETTEPDGGSCEENALVHVDAETTEPDGGSCEENTLTSVHVDAETTKPDEGSCEENTLTSVQVDAETTKPDGGFCEENISTSVQVDAETTKPDGDFCEENTSTSVHVDAETTEPDQDSHEENASVHVAAETTEPDQSFREETASIHVETETTEPDQGSREETASIHVETETTEPDQGSREENTSVHVDAETTEPDRDSHEETASVRVDAETTEPDRDSHEETASVHVDAETAEPDTSNSTKQCDTELPSTLEDSSKVQDGAANDGGKSTDDNVADESETLPKDKAKDCDIPDESSSNADDVQVSQREAASSKKIESESSDSNLDNLDPSEKNIEPENTEFIQFSHDKNDDSQIEVQSMDAEDDPFGGDNLTSENVEQAETDGLAENGLSFKKIYEQGDNLQDAVNARNNEECGEKLNVDSALNDPKDGGDVDKVVDNIAETPSNAQAGGVDSLENTPMDVDLPGAGTASETGAESMPPAKLPEEQDEQAKKTVEEITPMETDEEQADVLPGQDDELCIIPDSMKVIIPNKSGKTVDGNQSESALAKDSTSEETAQKSGKSNAELEKDTSKDESESASTSENKAEDPTKQKTVVQDERESTAKDVTPAADVINIDDEKTSEVEEISNKEVCKQCGEERACKIRVKSGAESYLVCSKTCKALFKAAHNKAVDIPSEGANSKREKRCATCLSIIETNDERNLSWETMEFCNEECLGRFQRKYGSFCKNCNGAVQPVSLGKYCVRFGCDVRQFCCSSCLEEFKKGLKVCSYCQKDISFSTDGFLAPVGEKGQFKDFCTQDCMEKYSKLNSTVPPATEKKPCSVCQAEKLVHCEVQIYNSTPVAICSEPCFAAFKFVKQVKPEQCSTCKKFFELPNKQHFIVFYENEPHTFCNKTCLNIFIITNRKIVSCNWCKVKKYNFDMIKKELKTGQTLMMCSLNCLTLYQVSINAVSAKRINCDFCKEYSLAHYHLTMSDATIRNFCSYNCVMNFQAQYTKSPITIPSSDDPVPTGLPKRTTLPQRGTSQAVLKDIQNKKTIPVISSVTSLAPIGNGQANSTSQQNSIVNASQAAKMVYKQQVITRPPSPVNMHNKTTQCKPLVHTKGVSVRPHPCTKSTQTTERVQQVVVPIPVPIYVPFPMYMYNMPFPVPMPFPLPIPVPLFIPTTRNSAKGIMKDIKRIQEKIPADPYEAELLMMAEMVATEKKANDSDSDSVDDREDNTADQDNLRSDGFSPEAVDSSNTFGDDMLQMALKMATGEFGDEPAVDLEAALTPNTITATQAPPQSENTLDNDVQSDRLMVASRGRKRVMPYKPRATPTKRMRRVSGTNDMPLMPPPEPQPPPQPRILEPLEKPDANMALKYTFGVNAWRQWVVGKNAELEKQITPTRKIKLFKTDLLQLTADELNYSLCLFVKEVRKPNGAEYAPDTIYYLCLGIQQYLFENSRIDNIFTDSYYEKFTDCLNEVAKKFSVLYNEAQYIVTRVEEEHLWECKQLGAHSPHVLLSTLMFFNTKHFNLVTVEEHMQLSFSHIMKHWKRNPAAQPTAVAGKVPGSRNVLLRFYPPQSALEANSRKKKVYEQQENEENPLRCPVKLYEFYLSKCPESVKTRNDVFYLLPERSCVPDSPVWYSTSPLAKEQLIKMLYRIKMVKEINVALLTS
ncbi:PREDICTED: zinc finger MYM-type protein 3 isoform X5 [Wasmannia auropunctata]|uniref:zinc finger MYM-type protein 3 isoform X5 n=1 Tax=Wasmannia auropunctata TaxID=64793 RepID=UPI0005ED9B0A|nr:PREDICTED: zinc finger MYM-type protein 3 isoform X5 [Wasmannia auropunctata]